MIVSASADRFASVGSLAIRPALYRGQDTGGAFATGNDPIGGLLVAIVGQKVTPSFHASTNVYGFVDLPGGALRLELTDPEGRYLPKAIEANVPDRLPLGAALARGATVLPIVPDPSYVTALLRPSPIFRAREHRAALFGTVTTPSGVPCPMAWIRVSTPQGRYVTYSDSRGEYLAPLPFLRPVVSVVDAGDEGDGDDELGTTDTFDVIVRAYRRSAPPPPEKPLTGFPADFDVLVPGQAAFAAVYDMASVFETNIAVTLDTHVRLDLLPG